MIPREILQEHGLAVEKLIKNTAEKEIYLVVDAHRNSYILKFYRKHNKYFQIEKAFLSTVESLQFTCVRFPKMVWCGESYIIIEYLEMEHYGRSAILKKLWSHSDVQLWVAGLLEFQQIRIPARYFSVKQRIIGLFFPVYSLLRQMPKCELLRNMNSLFALGKMCLLYCLAKLHFQPVLTHYDLQTYNYTRLKNETKMGLLDFEMLYFMGDPLYDLLYFMTIPIAGIEHWTFQGDLLREYIRQMPSSIGNSRSFMWRTRLILLLCNLARFLYLWGNPEERDVYANNIETLLSKSRFDNWFFRNFKEHLSD